MSKTELLYIFRRERNLKDESGDGAQSKGRPEEKILCNGRKGFGDQKLLLE